MKCTTASVAAALLDPPELTDMLAPAPNGCTSTPMENVGWVASRLARTWNGPAARCSVAAALDKVSSDCSAGSSVTPPDNEADEPCGMPASAMAWLGGGGAGVLPSSSV